ncbi:N-acetyl sugar amidotransferase [Synechococcus sp. MIT S9452]|uniref:N-acetyl sugar amidotransferase n=1 Tax=Synechococcus sp. MIT S9452 TaxID=3082546 RepID=UPI0039A5D986
MGAPFSTALRRCSRCLLPETHETLVLDAEGVCNVCRAQEVKAQINWTERLEHLDKLLEEYRGRYRYDCLIPFSGGKDSTWTLYYLMKRYPGLKPLVVRFNHGFLRPNLRANSDRVFRKLGVDVHDFTPNWKVVQRLMLQAFLEKGDFCWHCHTGIYAYPMQVALKEQVPLIFWGEPSAEYTAYYSYDQPEQVDEERFNRFMNLGISADDMLIRLDGFLEDRDLEPFRYPPLKDLRSLGYRSVCLGSYIPWDVKMQVKKIQSELGWQGDVVENVPEDFNYEKIECWMQGVRDFIKYIKRGYTRPTHLAAIDLRNHRITKEEAQLMIRQFEGKRPPSLDLFLEYVGLTEEEFYSIAITHLVSPWQFDLSEIRPGETTPDFDSWLRGDGLNPADAEDQVGRWAETCASCGSSGSCGPG